VAVLATASILASPYAFLYDMTLVAAAVAFIVAEYWTALSTIEVLVLGVAALLPAGMFLNIIPPLGAAVHGLLLVLILLRCRGAGFRASGGRADQISDTPEILWRTPVRTVGSLYHRSIGAFLRARDAWRSAPSGTVPQTVLATGATHILACESSERTALVAETTLQNKLAHHDVRLWLHEAGRAGGTVLKYKDSPEA
jgi:hypothetical protein